MENFGEKCKHESCRQLDFLPIQCRYCQNKFCNLHARAEQHNCDAYNKEKEKKTTVSESKEKKQRCGNNGCKTVLTLTNTYDCSKCGKKTCIKCRFPETHDCPDLKRQQQENKNRSVSRDPKLRKIEDNNKKQEKPKKKKGFFFCCGGKPQKKTNK